MNTFARLMIAGTAAALFSAQAMAMDSSKLAPVADVAAAAQQTTVAATEASAPEFCIAADKCAVALPADYLVRYDQHMDEILGR